jgi:hypothetical protein
VRAVNNAQSYRVGWTLPFDQLGVPSGSARRDSLHRGPAAWKTLLSRLGAVTLDGSYTEGSNYSRLSGTPHLPYLVGLSHDPGLAPDSTGSVRALFGNASTVNQDWRGSLRSRLFLGFGAYLSTHADFGATRSTFNNVVNRTQRVLFPDLDMDFGKIPEVIGLNRIFLSPKLRSAYSRSQTTSYANSETPTGTSLSSEWRPLLGLSGDTRNGTRVEFRLQHRATEARYTQVGSSVTTDANTDIDLSLTRNYTKGQKVSLLGRESTVKTSVSLGLTGTYSRRNSETRQQGFDRPFNPVAEDRLSVNGRGAYGFSDNVTGNVELGFSQNRDLQRDIVSRSIRVELRAQFGF